jgi:hypothetical protein
MKLFQGKKIAHLKYLASHGPIFHYFEVWSGIVCYMIGRIYLFTSRSATRAAKQFLK